jgi:hypothetical protein
MNKRPGPEQDDKRAYYYYLEQVDVDYGHPAPKKNYRIFPWVVIGGIISIGIAISSYWPRSSSLPESSTAAVPSALQQAVNQAMSAAELTQSAEYQEDWHMVAYLWQDAIRFMQEVPSSSPDHSLAQQKVGEYQRNLQYAQSNIQTRPPRSPDQFSFWGLGSPRNLVLAVQGTPTRINRADAECKETLYYDNSKVELLHGAVSAYDNADNNLQVSIDPSSILDALHTQNAWTLGSLRENVLQVQGTPTQVTHYNSLRREVLYYENSIVQLTHGAVTSYSNFDNNLRVTVEVLPSQSDSGTDTWTLGSTQADVFRIQGTPAQIQRHDSSCRTVLYYGDSTVDLRNGIVVGYDNFSNNLKVHLM